MTIGKDARSLWYEKLRQFFAVNPYGELNLRDLYNKVKLYNRGKYENRVRALTSNQFMRIMSEYSKKNDSDIIIVKKVGSSIYRWERMSLRSRK